MAETPPPAESPNGHIWYKIFATGDELLKKFQADNLALESPPRCKLCYAPFAGEGAIKMKEQGREPSNRNPLYCSLCDQFIRQFPGEAELEMTILFIDVRDSTGLAQRLVAPAKFRAAMKSFYDATFPILNESDGFIEDVRSDSILATYPPGLSGMDHAAKAIRAARGLLDVRVAAPDGSAVQFGIGVHTGIVSIGTMTSAKAGFQGISVEGPAAIVAARLCAACQHGEALVSTTTCEAAPGVDTQGLEQRSLELKGLNKPVGVRVFKA